MTPSIGGDVMTVSLLPSQEPAFLIDYAPTGSGGSGLSFTPWFITPSGVMAPMQATPMEMGVGGGEPFHLRVVGPTPTGPLLFGVQTQPRKAPPR
jgi:hypothetical protein